MRTVALGAQGLEVSRLGLGCLGMSEDFYGAGDEAESLATIDRALELGIALFDTADMYGPYTNEELLGRALRGRRERAVIATKFGMVRNEQGDWTGVCGRPDHVRSACEGSLRRLAVDSIDLYYQHRVDPDVPIEETVGAMAELVAEGKVRYLGLCEVTAETARRAHAIHPLTAVQSEYSLFSRDSEPVIPALRELGIGFVAYSPLGRGLLGGAIRGPQDVGGAWLRENPRYVGANLEHNLRLVEAVRQLAAERDATAAQLALAWVLAQGDDIVALAGTKRRRYVEQNAAAAEIELGADDLRRLEALVPAGAAAGPRDEDILSELHV
jgi:aryl-alcohol dehydrogenase-like predicted oxidoreductase